MKNNWIINMTTHIQLILS